MHLKTRYDKLKEQLKDLIFQDPINSYDNDSGEIYEVHTWEMAEPRLVIDHENDEEVETRIIGSHNLHLCFELISKELEPELKKVKDTDVLSGVNDILNDIMGTLVKEGLVRQRPEFNREQIKIIARNEIEPV